MDNPEKLQAMLAAFDEIQMPRTPLALEKLVVGARFTPEQQYAQCVLELSIAYDNLRLAKLSVQRKQLEMDALDRTKPLEDIDYQIKAIEQEKTQRAMLGAAREFEVLYDLWKSFPNKYTREELNAASLAEYTLQLQTQAQHDLLYQGRIAPSNQEGLRQLGLPLNQVAQLPAASPSPALLAATDPIERRYLAQGKLRILIGVPTEKKAAILSCLEGLSLPNGAEIKIFNCYGNPVADAYNFIAREALNDDADLLVTVEDDTFPQPDAIVRLVKLVLDERAKGNRCAAGAWYPKREECRQGVHIIVGERERGPLSDADGLHEVYTLAMGCSVYPVQMFREIQSPWFKTTTQLSQDSYFSQLARDAGWKLLVDTSIRCKHVDRVTGRVYE
jgi:hypothetical protein